MPAEKGNSCRIKILKKPLKQPMQDCMHGLVHSLIESRKKIYTYEINRIYIKDNVLAVGLLFSFL